MNPMTAINSAIDNLLSFIAIKNISIPIFLPRVILALLNGIGANGSTVQSPPTLELAASVGLTCLGTSCR